MIDKIASMFPQAPAVRTLAAVSFFFFGVFINATACQGAHKSSSFVTVTLFLSPLGSIGNFYRAQAMMTTVEKFLLCDFNQDERLKLLLS